MRLYLIVLCLLCPFGMHAQNNLCSLQINGRVLDKLTGQVVANIRVVLNPGNHVAYSDSNGNYRIAEICPGPSEITVFHFSHVAYHEKIKLSVNSNRDFYIDCHPDTLREITIKRNKLHREALITLNTMEGADLFRAQGSNLGKALEAIPGVQSVSTGNNITKPMIRGMYGNRILILNNEIRQEGQQWGNEHAPEIDPFMARKITVIKGAQTIRYGSDVMGGVVQVEPLPLNLIRYPLAELNLGAATNGRGLNTSMLLEGKAPKTSLFWRVQGTYRRGGNQKTPDYFLKNTGIRELNYSAALGYYTNTWSAEVFHSYFNTNIGIFAGSHIGNLSDLYDAFQASRPLDSSGFSYTIDLPYQEVRHAMFKAKFTRKTVMGPLTVTYGYQKNIRKEYDRSLKTLQDDGTYKPALHFNLGTHTLDIRQEQRPMWRIRGGGGAQMLYQQNLYYGSYFIPVYDRWQGGLYWTESYTHRQFSAELGVRYDLQRFDVVKWEQNVLRNHTHQWHQPAASFAIRYNLRPFTFHVNGGTTWRAPFVNELHSYGVHHSAASFEIGDSSLRPERGYNLAFTTDFNNRKHHAELTCFVHDIQDYIHLQPVFPATLTIRGAFPTFQYMQSHVRFVGVEFAWTSLISARLHNHLKGSFIQASNLTRPLALTGIPPGRIQNEVEWTLRKTTRTQFNLVAEGIYVFRQNRVPDSADYIPSPPAWFLFNLSVNGYYIHRLQTLRFEVGCQNVLNQRYRDYLNRNRYFAQETGRNFFIKCSIPIYLKKVPDAIDAEIQVVDEAGFKQP
ncbi:MAG: TonB-dependent receptor [Chitinophagaceae bacterium]|nr:TonB-dependent receptor [Chitinophagaceae bacterium]